MTNTKQSELEAVAKAIFETASLSATCGGHAVVTIDPKRAAQAAIDVIRKSEKARGLVSALKTFDEAMRNGSMGVNNAGVTADMQKIRYFRAAHKKALRALSGWESGE